MKDYLSEEENGLSKIEIDYYGKRNNMNDESQSEAKVTQLILMTDDQQHCFRFMPFQDQENPISVFDIDGLRELSGNQYFDDDTESCEPLEMLFMALVHGLVTAYDLGYQDGIDTSKEQSSFEVLP